MKRILSILFMCLFVVLSPTRASAACTSSQIDVLGDGTQCETSKFELTTTSLAANTTFTFTLGATGTFYVDWGDGGAVETIASDSVTATDYTHTYTTAGVYTIRFSGLATAYDVSSNGSTSISFYKASGGSQGKIASISGNLASIFPYLGSENNQAPRFWQTFRGATNLTSIPATLFRGITTGGGGRYMFGLTFYGCTGLTSSGLPATLFSDITTGADSMFYGTFENCTGLTSLPEGLFSTITTGAAYMFNDTFWGCTGLTRIPARLFSGLTTVGGYMFQFLFNGCKNLAGVIPPDTVAGLIANGSPTQNYMWISAFNNTKLATSCPAGTYQYLTGYEGSGSTTFNGKVSCACDAGYWGDGNTCTACSNTHPAHSSYAGLATTATCPWVCDAGYYWDGTACSVCSNSAPANSTFTPGSTTATCPWTCNAGYITNGNSCDAPAFSVTTTSLPFGDKFTFSLSAVGTFYVNWGDGTEETIVRDNTTSTWYTHTYTTPGTYTIGFGGEATAYNTSSAAISFYKSSGGTQGKIASISGNLASIFPYLGSGSGQAPRFSSTFRGATNLTSISANLFSGITTGGQYMFSYTFYGCTGLTSIPAELFSGITTGADYMFQYTFSGCTGLTSIPAGLFSSIVTGARYMFYYTFNGCTGLTRIPSGLFSNLASVGQYMFSYLFNGCTNLGGYIPPDTFAQLIKNGSPTATYLWNNAFNNTQLLTECPTGTQQYITRYEGSGAATWNGKVSCGCEAGYWADGSTCTACSNTIPAHSSYTTGAANATCPWSCDSGYVSNGTSCVEPAFSVTTTSLSANDTFTFSLSAVGTFYVNWGDGTEEKYVRTNTTATNYSHTYATSGTYTIGFGGVATSYNTSSAAISFYKSSGGSQGKIASISGNLGAIFPYLGSGDTQAPMFSDTFRDATNLTSIPANLFSGITAGGEEMFQRTFQGCTGLTAIPSGLFNNITSAQRIFDSTFSGCTSLTTIPANLFSGITTGTQWMFLGTFQGCTSLTTIPDGLFNHITGGADNMFYGTFQDCTSLTTIPSGLFSHITGNNASSMFGYTFRNCTSLVTIPSGLFSSVTSVGRYMFERTFNGCTSLTTIPSNLFSGITSISGSYVFEETFSGCTSLTTIPDGLFSNITNITSGSQFTFYRTFNECTSLTTIPSNLFSGLTTGSYATFNSTFYGCTALTSLPDGLFSGITTTGTGMFLNTFRNCTNLSGFIPPTFFAGLINANSPYTTNFMSNTFNSTGLLTACPAGYTQYITGYESYWNSKVSCQPCAAGTYKDTAGNGACTACPTGTYMSGTGATECTACTNGPANSTYTSGGGSTNTCEWSCDSGTIPIGTQCETAKFEVTTTQLSANDTFIFSLSATGTFYVDWGDGSAIETITRSRTWSTEYSHTYANAGSYTIRFGGDATGYNTSTSTAAISFYKSSGGTQSKIASVSGSLGALLPQLGTADGQYPRFVDTFRGATNMTSVSGTLFSGLTGGTYMFYRTFYGCTGLTSVPGTLFSGITTGATNMFYYTFSGCTGLTSLPTTLFSGITTGANYMFAGTFSGCTGLTSLPATLFSGITTGAEFLFHYTFSGCTGLTTIPGTLFSGITAGVYEMFAFTFYNCTGLTSIPGNLFSNLTTVANRMFEHTFDGCSGLTSIPENLFSSVTTGAVSLFYGTFENCTGLTSIPATLFGNITTGANSMFDCTFDGCTSLTSIPATLFSSITTFGDSMFGSTFSGCTSLTTIPATLFSNVTTPTTNLFHYTFYGCTGLTSIPAGLFSGVTGSAEGLFNNTFYGCSNLTSIPAGLFNGITGGAIRMFYYTFFNTGLTSLPDGLFANITTGANYMFQSTFGYCRNLSGYVPPTMFAGLIANNSPYSTNMMTTIFNNTALDTACPAGTTQYITNYESYWNSKVSCEPCAGTLPEHASYVAGTCDWVCDSGYINTGTSCEMPKFSVTTTSDATTLNWTMTATGEFYADCGDGGTLTQSGTTTGSTISGNTITRTGISDTTYTCTWDSAGAHTVRFGGTATGYSTSITAAAIAFFKSSGGTQSKVASISGSLGAMFPYISGNAADGAQPRFYQTFRGATQLTTVPATLFANYATGATSMFSYTFSGCTGLTSIPAGLFSGITTAAGGMFYNTFNGCTSLTSIPAGLFSGMTTGAQSLFSDTFYGCTGLTTVPEGLFSGITTAASYMFRETFRGCTGLTSIPTLFGNISGGADYMFDGTFEQCTNLATIPETLFSGITTGASYMFEQTFSSCSSLQVLPSFANITTGVANTFYYTFYSCPNLSGYIPPTMFAGLIAAGAPANTFNSTFQNSYTLVSVCPAGTTQYVTGFEGVRTWNDRVSCQPCPAGTYKDVAGNQACSACPAGTYIGTTGATACTACPAVTSGFEYASGTGGSGYSDCVEQKQPEYCLGYLTKTATSASTWGPAVSTLTAIGGYEVTGSGENELCVPCGVGRYGPGGTTACSSCPTGLTTAGYGSGADEAGDCGRILHVSNGVLYLRSDKKTTPSLNVRIGNDVFYGNMSTEQMSMSGSCEDNPELKVNNGGTIYWIHDDSSYFCGVPM